MPNRKSRPKPTTARRKPLETPFDEETIEAVWKQAAAAQKAESLTYLKDEFGTWIHRTSYGTKEEFGWEIDGVITPGSSDISHLQPLHWKNKRFKADGCFEPEIFEASE